MSPLTETLLFGGLIGALPWWGYLTIGLVLTHILVMSVSLYLHRGETHRAVTIHPTLAVVFRTLFWLSQTSTVKEWVAVHRKHHRYVDEVDDPHSPKFHKLWKMLFASAYRRETKNKDTVRIYGKGTPEDWLERNLFTKYRRFGVALLALLMISLFGAIPGVILWLAEVTYLPIVASFGVNGLGHLVGYRNSETKDASRNVIPFDPIACGEFLHNNHHTDPNSAKFSFERWETDIGWGWLKLFGWLRLAKVRYIYRPPDKKPSAVFLEDEAVLAFARYMPYAKKKFDAKVWPSLKKTHGGSALVDSLKSEFHELCNRVHTPSTLQSVLTNWLEKARRLNNEKLRDFCDWLIMIRVPSLA